MRFHAIIASGVLLLSAAGCSHTDAQSPLEYGGVSGVLSTGNTSHYSLEFTNTGDRAVLAVRGVVELLDDFGEVSGTIPVELTRQTRRE